MLPSRKLLVYTCSPGAALALECAGQYKYQHDTSKDLMFVHVFPRVDPAAAAALAAGDGPGVPDAMSPTQLLLFSEPAVFERMVAAIALGSMLCLVCCVLVGACYVRVRLRRMAKEYDERLRLVRAGQELTAFDEPSTDPRLDDEL